jgi:hypothetical protein
MTTIDRNRLDSILADGLRKRAADVGGEDDLYRRIVATAAKQPQRRGLLAWLSGADRRTLVLISAGLLAAGLVSAAVGARLLVEPLDPPLPTLRNGPLLILQERDLTLIDATTGAAVGGPPTLPDDFREAAWSRDGRRLATIRAGNLSVVDAVSGDRRVVATCSSSSWLCAPAHDRRLDWSPDGVTIAVAVGRRIILVDVATGREMTVLDDPLGGVLSNPSWTPDGKRIAFDYAPIGSLGHPGFWEIQVIDRDGSNRRRLSDAPAPESAGYRQPSWSPDGTRIVFLASGAWQDTGSPDTSGWPTSVMSYRLAGGEPAGSPVKVVDVGTIWCDWLGPYDLPLGPPRFAFADPLCVNVTVSPDGTSVAFDDGSSLAIVSIDGGGRTEHAIRGRIVGWQPVP